MKPISIASLIASLFVLGISLLWYPDICDIITTLMPVGTPDYISKFLAILPYASVAIMIIILIKRLSKRGTPRDFEQ